MKKSPWSILLIAAASIGLSLSCGGDDESSMQPATEAEPEAPEETECPETSPGDGAECAMRTQVCAYDGMVECTCETAFMGQFGQTTWECRGGGQGGSCPGAEPMAGSTCTPMFGDCEYGERTCDCVGSTNSWSCWSESDCPETPPEQGSACEIEAIECEYPESECDCEDAAWDCATMS